MPSDYPADRLGDLVAAGLAERAVRPQRAPERRTAPVPTEVADDALALDRADVEAPPWGSDGRRGVGQPIGVFKEDLQVHIREGRPHQALRLLVTWVDDLRAAATTGAPPDELAGLCAEPPQLDDPRWDVLVAGVVLHWARLWGVTVPAWAEHRAVRLEEPFCPAGDDERARRRADRDPVDTLATLNIWLAADWAHTV